MIFLLGILSPEALDIEGGELRAEAMYIGEYWKCVLCATCIRVRVAPLVFGMPLVFYDYLYLYILEAEKGKC